MLQTQCEDMKGENHMKTPSIASPGTRLRLGMEHFRFVDRRGG